MILYILAAVGLAGIILGFLSLSYLKRFSRSRYASSRWHKLRTGVLLFGILIGLLSWPGTFFMGYSYKGEAETGRVVGIPFIVAYFDSKGHDYVGPFAIPGIIANGLFWFTFPHIFLAVYSRRLTGG